MEKLYTLNKTQFQQLSAIVGNKRQILRATLNMIYIFVHILQSIQNFISVGKYVIQFKISLQQFRNNHKCIQILLRNAI